MVLSPSSYGLQPWKFIVITDTALRKKLTPLSWGQTQVEDSSHFVVFTYRNPDDFFDNVQLPLISTDEGIAQDLLKTKRHQKVRIFGAFVEGKAPIKHIDVSKMVLILLSLFIFSINPV